MGHDSGRLPRRNFLTQCAAASLAAGVVPPTAAADENPTLETPRKSEAELARSVDALLQLLDPRLHYRRTPVPPERNAWPVWAEAHQAYVPPPGQNGVHRPFDEFLHYGGAPSKALLARITAWVRQNERCRQLIEAGIARGQLELPRASRGARLPMAMDETDAMRDLSGLLTIASRVSLLAGDVDAALEAGMAAIAMGRLQLHAECLLVDLLIATSNLNRGIRAVFHAAMNDRASADQRKRAIAALAGAEITPADFAAAYRVELCRWFLPTLAGYPDEPDPEKLTSHYAAELLDVGDTGQAPNAAQLRAAERFRRDLATVLTDHPRPFNKQDTVRLANDLHLSYVDSLSRPWLTRGNSRLEQLIQELSAWPTELSGDGVVVAGMMDDEPEPAIPAGKLRAAKAALRKIDNVFGKYLVDQATGTMDVPTLHFQQAGVAAAQLRIALRMYEATHGRLPTELRALVAEGLPPAVPRDPFDGQSFKYSAERRVLWCVGRDGANQGKLPEHEDPEFPRSEDSDLTWRVVRP